MSCDSSCSFIPVSAADAFYCETEVFEFLSNVVGDDSGAAEDDDFGCAQTDDLSLCCRYEAVSFSQKDRSVQRMGKGYASQGVGIVAAVGQNYCAGAGPAFLADLNCGFPSVAAGNAVQGLACAKCKGHS